jgi:hypothetical protein
LFSVFRPRLERNLVESEFDLGVVRLVDPVELVERGDVISGKRVIRLDLLEEDNYRC